MTQQKLVPANSVRRALNILGDQWVLVILRELFIGRRSYGELHRATGAAHATLTRRLQQLTGQGLISQRGFRYTLEESGSDLLDFILAMRHWQVEWQEAPRAVRPLRHLHCDTDADYTLVCSSCREPLHYQDVAMVEGPGAAVEEAAPQRHLRRGKSPATGEESFQVPAICRDQRAAQVLNACYQGHLGFQSLQNYLQLPPQVIASRLKLLQDLDFLRARSGGKRAGYRLTERALAFYPVLLALNIWADNWLAGEKGPPQLLVHRPCGQPIEAASECSHCHELVHYGDLQSH